VAGFLAHSLITLLKINILKTIGIPHKNNPLLTQRIIKSSSNPGDFVLDYFSGFATTLFVLSTTPSIENNFFMITTTFAQRPKNNIPK